MKTNFKFVLSFILLISLAAVFLGGCNPVTTTTTTTITLTTTATTTTTSSTTTTATTAAPVIVNVSAASSLTDVLKELNALYVSKNSNVTITPNFASSGTLQTQIEQGAPADVFISAAAKQMDALQKGGLIINETRRDLLNNKIVIVVPANSILNLSSFTDLTGDAVKQIAIGDPASVPAGTYAKQVFDSLGIYDQISAKFILCTDVRQVLSYVEAGNVDAGVVYATDAAITDGVKVVAFAPDNIKIIYPVAIIKASKNVTAAQAYIDFLCGNEAKAIFEKYGFTVVSR